MWPLVQLFNFRYMPLRFRVYVSSSSPLHLPRLLSRSALAAPPSPYLRALSSTSPLHLPRLRRLPPPTIAVWMLTVLPLAQTLRSSLRSPLDRLHLLRHPTRIARTFGSRSGGDASGTRRRAGEGAVSSRRSVAPGRVFGFAGLLCGLRGAVGVLGRRDFRLAMRLCSTHQSSTR